MKKGLPILILAILILVLFTSCGQNNEISFMVNGEVYANKTIDFNKELNIVVPKDPKKEGYVFEGWFFDNNVWQQPLNENHLFDIGKNYFVYAKWVDVSAVKDSSTDTLSSTSDFLRINEDYSLNPNGDHILFGSYPQTIKASDVDITTTTKNQGQFTYYKGSDNEWYAKVVISKEGDCFEFSNEIIAENNVAYFFKVEPIRWRILNENYIDTDGTKTNCALVLCDSIIYNTAYQSEYEHVYDYNSYFGSTTYYYNKSNGVPENTYADNYQYSQIRKWLNEQFFNTAFNSLQKEIIKATNIDNSLINTNNSTENESTNTNDKVFLPSYQVVTNIDYGFSKYISRKMTPSDFCRANEAYTDGYNEDYGYGKWWLRSTRDYNNEVCVVESDGRISEEDVKISSIGVAPALLISLD